MSQPKFLLVVGGPTASGKTEFAIQLARYFNTHILSCDSRQFFREMNIGTAKPTTEEMAAVPHHFIGQLSIIQEYSVGAYEQDALHLLNELFREKDIVILVGGSGLYLKALCEGLDEFPKVPISIRNEVEALFQKEGLSALQTALEQVDPGYFNEADRQNPHRLIRALSVYRASGKPFSSFRKNEVKKRSFSPIYMQMHWPRQQLYARINQRVDIMIRQGLLDEVHQLLPYREHPALQTVGYQEIFDYLDGQYDWSTAVDLIKRNSRRYAKRQLTWMRRDGFWKHFHPDEWQEALAYLHIVMEGNWQWHEHSYPFPDKLIPLFNLENKNKNKVRVLALEQNRELLAALILHTTKHFEGIEQLHLKPDLSPTVVYHFLQEAKYRCEDAPIHALLPDHFFPLFQPWGFSRITKENIPDPLINFSPPTHESNWGYWRNATDELKV